MQTRYVAKIEFRKGERTVLHSTLPVLAMSTAVMDADTLARNLAMFGWVGTLQDVIAIEGDQHQVDAIATDMRLEACEIGG